MDADRGRRSAGRRALILPRIERLTTLPPGVAALTAEAEADGLRFVQRLIDEWRSGANRFDGPGEALFGAFRDARLLGVCGLNRDPYVGDPRVGRLRHLYVLRAERRHGIASALVARALAEADGMFASVRLRTTREAADFYERRGFAAIADATATHVRDTQGIARSVQHAPVLTDASPNPGARGAT